MRAVQQGEQLALLESPPIRLTDRQQVVMDALTRNGQDGLDADQAGALWCSAKSIHGPDDRCGFDGKSGLGILHELQAKGLTRYRRANRARGIHGAWLSTDVPATEDDGSLPSGMTDEIPY